MGSRFHVTTLLAAVVVAAAPASAFAQDPDGTLARVAETGEFRIGYRTDARPLSFVDEDGEPAGYSVELCRHIATAVKARLDRDDINIRFVPVTTDNRLDAVVGGDIDIECGSTTISLGRLERVDFTVMTFVTGGALLSRADGIMRNTADLAGRSVAVIRGTTTAESLNARLTEESINAEVVSVANRADGMARLQSGEVDALASDQIVLIGQIMEMDDPQNYAMAQELFSYEPYALMVPRNDAEFRLVADRALVQIFRTDQYVDIFNRWIGRGTGIRPSSILVALYRVQELPE